MYEDRVGFKDFVAIIIREVLVCLIPTIIGVVIMSLGDKPVYIVALMLLYFIVLAIMVYPSSFNRLKRAYIVYKELNNEFN